ncbi:MAG: hypothetical protein JXR84_08405 [Anaerolineae bacterium]|nr:hypothetical protein [Anaerolineae bacterium]
MATLGTYAANPLYSLSHGDNLHVITQRNWNAAVQTIGLILAQRAFASDDTLDIPGGEGIPDNPHSGFGGTMWATGIDSTMDLPGTTFEFASQLARRVLHME